MPVAGVVERQVNVILSRIRIRSQLISDKRHYLFIFLRLWLILRNSSVYIAAVPTFWVRSDTEHP